jgi:hypothetical protein
MENKYIKYKMKYMQLKGGRGEVEFKGFDHNKFRNYLYQDMENLLKDCIEPSALGKIIYEYAHFILKKPDYIRALSSTLDLKIPEDAEEEEFVHNNIRWIYVDDENYSHITERIRRNPNLTMYQHIGFFGPVSAILNDWLVSCYNIISINYGGLNRLNSVGYNWMCYCINHFFT